MNFLSPHAPETMLEAGGAAKGVAVALVCDNKDPEGLGRVKVSYPWHTQENQSYWARIAAPMAGKDRGVYFLPEIDDEVLVVFDRGDVRFPYVIGALWNGKDTPPETNGDGKNNLRVIHSRKGHRLTFDDGARGMVRLELDDGKKLEIDDDGIKLEDGGGNSLTIESDGGTLSIKAAAKLTISAPNVEISATAQMKIDGGGFLVLRAGMININ
ncbi:phage baseplate assembly protein V [Microvirga splendida]|uniref:Gp5/Type VI secretion system Vgr protein OB-fold domain-containing protein n=1 Tax=Microvirga splendida TaxID=2795727 RepID=A0ABS0Y4H6_9HYPH|nr:phage baseplate assembly protein V [Microvirga splendida]MBJ6127193.1 hypothetical protein [Microvirga splendida]